MKVKEILECCWDSYVVIYATDSIDDDDEAILYDSSKDKEDWDELPPKILEAEVTEIEGGEDFVKIKDVTYRGQPFVYLTVAGDRLDYYNNTDD